MKRYLMLACMVLFAGPALACVPPPGLTFQQWYGVCQRDMEDGFSRGFGGSQSHQGFMMSMYRMYQGARPTYNPVIAGQQADLANKMARGQNQFMNNFNEQRDRRNEAFAYSQKEKAWQQNNTMMYIQDEHCLLWNTAHTYCLKVHN